MPPSQPAPLPAAPLLPEAPAPVGTAAPAPPAPNPYKRFLNTPAVVPLTPRQKARLAFRNLTNPFNLITIVGTSGYTSGSCTYNLRLVSSNTTQVELHEEVTGGACEPDYAIVAVKDGKLTENVYVISPDEPPDFTGTLAKS